MKRGSLIHQVKQALLGQLHTGQSRHEAKMDAGSHRTDGIYSYGTLDTYMRQCCRFARWVKAAHGCNTLGKAKPYVEEYLRLGMDRGLSSHTLCTQRAALCKLYGLRSSDLDVRLPERRRAGITRSRGTAVRDSGFSLGRNSAIIAFAKATGLRRHELAAVTPSHIQVTADGAVQLCGIVGKGGKTRDIDVLPGHEQAVLRFISGPSDKRIFPRVPSHMDVHGCRREYADAMYRTYLARHGWSGQKPYRCRRDKRGTVYDREAMLYVSRQLGHNRINVIAEHYLS